MAEVTFPTEYGGDGKTYTDDADPETGLDDVGYQVRFVPALKGSVAMAAYAKGRADAAKEFAEECQSLRNATKTDRESAASSASGAAASKTAAAGSAGEAKRAAAQMNADDIMHRKGSGLSNEVGDAAKADFLDQISVKSQKVVRQAIGADFERLGLGEYGKVLSTTDDLFQVKENGLYSWRNPPVNAPRPYCSAIVISLSSNNGMIICLDSNKDVYTNASNNGIFGSWSKQYGQSNTTVDSNGFIKSASPIFRLSNQSEYASGDGFTLDGCGAYNGEAAGVTASHDDVGVYTVSGSLGFAADGWTIEIPQDVNGNRLCFVETDTADDGTITVRTFGRRFDFETAMIVAGDPLDIPDGRWIDLRLRMPEVEMADDDGGGV